MTSTNDAIASLPFTAAKLGVATRLWVVEPSGDWAADNEAGRNHAESLIACMAEHDLPNLLGLIVKAMKQDGGTWSGIEVGFFHRLAERLS